jgi:hypothetical protein
MRRNRIVPGEKKTISKRAKNRRALLLFFTAICTIAAARPQVLSGPDATALARKYLADFREGRTEELWQKMTPEMQAALKDAAVWKTMPAQLRAQLGEEGKVEDERTVPGIHMQLYTRLSEFSAMPGKFVTTFALTDQGQIAGFSIRPLPNPAETKYLEYKDKGKYTLPFKGPWLIYQGGRSTYENYHAAYLDERFAYDITAVKDGKLYSGNGDKREEFFSFGQAVLAPADGSVVAAVDQYEDNPIMKPSSTGPKEGNNVVIDHGNGEFSMLAHLRRGSVKVKLGDKVKAGQEIGQCGNSGNSPFPHLHWHLQTTSVWFKGEGLPVQVRDYVAGGKPVEIGEPVRGEVVQSK